MGIKHPYKPQASYYLKKRKCQRVDPDTSHKREKKKSLNLLMDVFAMDLTAWVVRIVGVLVDPLICGHLQTCVSCVFSKKQ